MTDPDVKEAAQRIRRDHAEHLREALKAWPPLTPEQRDRLAVILHK